MYRFYIPLPDPVEAHREWHADAPWRLAGIAVLLSSAVATSALYVRLGKMALSAFAG